MEDLVLLKRAVNYMEKMAMGKNPVTNKDVPQGDTVSEKRVQNCCIYVRDVLDKIIKNDGMIGKRKKFTVTDELLSKIEISEIPIGISDFAKRINAVKEDTMRGISGTKIASWLAREGYISTEKIGENKTRKVINERSKEIGIISESKVSRRTGEIYDQLLYSAEAQRFILENLDKIIE